eukprot:6456615-Amphidinium_carterae.1
MAALCCLIGLDAQETGLDCLKKRALQPPPCQVDAHQTGPGNTAPWSARPMAMPLAFGSHDPVMQQCLQRNTHGARLAALLLHPQTDRDTSTARAGGIFTSLRSD